MTVRAQCPCERVRSPRQQPRRRARGPAAAALTILLSGAAGCIPGPPQELTWIRQDIKGLQEQVRNLRTEVRRPELAAQVKSMEERQRRSQQALSDRMVEIEQRLGEVGRQMELLQATAEEVTHATDEARKENAALTARLATAESAVREAGRLAGEQQNHLAPVESHLAAVQAEVDALAKQVSALLSRKAAPPPAKVTQKTTPKKVSSPPAKPTTATATTPAKETAGKTEATGVDAAVQATYDAALKEIRSGDRDKGIAAMEAFAKENPHTTLTDNAYFWIGQGYYAAGEYKRAIFNFDTLFIGFPKSNKAPGALLKEGLSFLALARDGKGDATFDDARMALQQVIHDYPDSAEAKIAQGELAKLDGK